MIVYTYAEVGMNCLKNKMKYYTLFSVLRWEFASVYVKTERFYENIIQEARFDTLKTQFL